MAGLRYPRPRRLKALEDQNAKLKKRLAESMCWRSSLYNRRHTSKVAWPLYCSFKIPMICSSVNRLLRNAPSTAGALHPFQVKDVRSN